MASRTKRSLRNSNTCPSVQNPLKLKPVNQQLQEMLPEEMKQQLTGPQLTCPQISTLSSLTFPSCAEEALARMRAAREWQSGTVNGSLKREQTTQSYQQQNQKGIFDYSPPKMSAPKNQPPQERQESVLSAVFQHELQDFIMSSPPAHYEFDLDYEPKYIYLPSKNELFFNGMSQFQL